MKNLGTKFLQWLDVKKAVVIIALLGSIVYLNILGNGFVWDDEEQIVNNAVIQNLANLPQILSGATFGTGGAGLSGWFFRPLLTLSYMLCFAVFGQGAWGYHLLQLLLHLASAVLFFLVLQRLTSATNAPDNARNKKLLLINTLAALLFAVHPLNVEAVAYIGSSHYVWLTLLNLSAFLLILKNNTQKISLQRYAGAAALLLGGMLFNESSIIIFPILAAYLILWEIRNWRGWTIMLSGTLASYLIVRLAVVRLPFGHPAYSPISEASFFHRLLTIPREFVLYLRLFLWPDKLAVSQHFVVTSLHSPDFYASFIIAALALGAILFAAWRLQSKLILFGLIWFLLGFGLVSNVFPLDMTIAERWMYFPFIGFLMIAAGILQFIAVRSKNIFWILCVLLAASLVPLGIRTITRNANWHDGLALYAHDITVSRNSFDLENNLGVELFRAGNIEQAKPHFEKSIALQPKWYFAWNNLGAVYEHEGDWQKAAELYQECLNRGDYYLAYENLAGIKLNHGTPQDAKQFTERALKKLPNNSKLWFILAVADYKLNLKDEAITAAFNAYQLMPSDQTYYLYKQLKDGEALNLQ